SSNGETQEEVAQLALMIIEEEEDKVEICLKALSRKTQWYLDSGCLKHMTGDKSLFVALKLKQGGDVTFGDNAKGKIVGFCSIGNNHTSISNVLYVDGLKHNLLSISQLCEKDCRVIFEKYYCKRSYRYCQ
ncbi:hypothetical protein CFOL_v3_02440, partial [Cephalotus follicularis]